MYLWHISWLWLTLVCRMVTDPHRFDSEHSQSFLNSWQLHQIISLEFGIFVSRTNKKVVALKEIRLQEEEGTPFTAIREGWWLWPTCIFNTVAIREGWWLWPAGIRNTVVVWEKNCYTCPLNQTTLGQQSIREGWWLWPASILNTFGLTCGHLREKLLYLPFKPDHTGPTVICICNLELVVCWFVQLL